MAAVITVFFACARGGIGSRCLISDPALSSLDAPSKMKASDASWHSVINRSRRALKHHFFIFGKKEQGMSAGEKNAPVAVATTGNEQAQNPLERKVNASAAQLKERFGEQKIPLAGDFSSLIDMAEVGCRAVGQASDQDGKPGAGLALDQGRLKVVHNPAKGLVVEPAGIGINVGNGVELADNQLKVKPNGAKGIIVNNDGVALKLKTESALTLNSDGLAVKVQDLAGVALTAESSGTKVKLNVKVGNGAHIANNEVQVKANSAKGLLVESAGVGINVGNGVELADNQLKVKPNGAKGIVVNDDGVALKLRAESALTLNSDGLAVKVQDLAGVALTAESSGTKGKLNVKVGDGVHIANDEVQVKVNAAKGIVVEPAGVGIKDDAWMRMMAKMHNASHVAVCEGYAALMCHSVNGVTRVHLYPRGHWSPIATSMHTPTLDQKEAVHVVGGIRWEWGSQVNDEVSVSSLFFKFAEGAKEIKVAVWTASQGHADWMSAEFKAVV